MKIFMERWKMGSSKPSVINLAVPLLNWIETFFSNDLNNDKLDENLTSI